ncbi:MAG: hypothetical protein ABI305_03840 [Tepidiformaceae bacterium]
MLKLANLRSVRISLPTRRLVVVIPLLALVSIGASLAIRTASQSNAQSAHGCSAGYPFESIPCDLYQRGDNRALLADPATAKSVPVPAEQASALIHKLSPGSSILETRLVETWSSESGNPVADRKLYWAVSTEPPGGNFISGGAFFLKEVSRVRADGDTRPLTPAEQAAVNDAVQSDIRELRASAGQTYHVDFVDPMTGEYVGAVEGSD